MKKFLIILDLNGTLLQRLKKDPRPGVKCLANIHGRPVVIRPHLTSFLSSLLNTHQQQSSVDVGVWTSALPKNAVPMVMLAFGSLLNASVYTDETSDDVAESYANFAGRPDFPGPTGTGRLAFIWSQAKCDIKGYGKGSRGKGDVKPDFLKNLQKVWDAFPHQYGPENTIIIDDSPGKILAGHEPNHLLIPEFDVERSPRLFKGDAVLQRLEQYLAGLVEAQPADVREYMSSHPFVMVETSKKNN